MPCGPGVLGRAGIAIAEYVVPRIGLAVVRALDRDVVGQAHHPRGAAGRVGAWEMAWRPSNRRRNRWVVSLLDVGPADRVLEIGFGPGVAVAALARSGAGHVYGIDHSEVMLERAARRNAAAIRAGRVTLLRCSVDRIPPEVPDPVDVVVAVNSLGFWSASAERLSDLRERLRPGGRIAIASQPRCPGATAATSRDAARRIEDMLLGAGFVDTSTHTLPLSPPVVCVLAGIVANRAPSGGVRQAGPL